MCSLISLGKGPHVSNSYKVGPLTNFKGTYNGLKITIFYHHLGSCFLDLFSKHRTSKSKGYKWSYDPIYVYIKPLLQGGPLPVLNAVTIGLYGFFIPIIHEHFRPFILHKVYFTQFYNWFFGAHLVGAISSRICNSVPCLESRSRDMSPQRAADYG